MVPRRRIVAHLARPEGMHRRFLMTQEAELHRNIDNLPPKYFGEVINFVAYLQHKAQNEENPVLTTKFPASNTGRIRLTKIELEKMLEKSPITRELSGLLADLGDISADQIREERLARYLK